MEEDEGDPGPERVLRAAALCPDRGAAASAAAAEGAAEPGGGAHRDAGPTDVLIG